MSEEIAKGVVKWLSTKKNCEVDGARQEMAIFYAS